METQVKALTILLSALRGRFVCGNSAFSQQISTFYGPSVQAMKTRLGARQRRRPPTVHRGSTHAPRLQRPVASEDEASACSELRLGCHPETLVIEPCLKSLYFSQSKCLASLSLDIRVRVFSSLPKLSDARAPYRTHRSCVWRPRKS